MLQEQSQLNWTAIICRLETQLCLLLWKVKREFCNRQGKYLSPSVLTGFFNHTVLPPPLPSFLIFWWTTERWWKWWWKVEKAEKIFGAFRLKVKREAVVWYTFKTTIIQITLATLVSQKKTIERKINLRLGSQWDLVLSEMRECKMTIEKSLFQN